MNRPLTAARVATAVAAFICPTRRQAVPYPYPQWFVYNLHNTPPAVGHTDYAGCVGDTDEAATSGPLTFGPDTGRGALADDFHNASQTGGDDMPSNVQWLAVRPGSACARWRLQHGRIDHHGRVRRPHAEDHGLDQATPPAIPIWLARSAANPDHYVDGGDNGDNKGWDFGFIFGNVALVRHARRVEPRHRRSLILSTRRSRTRWAPWHR